MILPYYDLILDEFEFLHLTFLLGQQYLFQTESKQYLINPLKRTALISGGSSN